MNDELPWTVRFRGAIERPGFCFLLRNEAMRSRLAKPRLAEVDGRKLSPEVAAMLRLDDIAERSDLRKLSPVAARARVAGEVSIVDAPAPPGVEHRDLEFPGPGGALRARLYTPLGLDSTSPAIVYFHGGGWVTGSIGTHDGLCRRLALGVRCRVVSVDYRLAPEHRFPAAALDCIAAFEWVIRSADTLGIDRARVAVAGDSAGGNLSAVVSQATSGAAAVPRLAVLLYPALDMTARGRSHETVGDKYFLTLEMIEWYYAHYVGQGDRRDPLASPLLAPSLPSVNTLIFTCGFDPLRDEGRAYADRLEAAGSPVRYREFPDLIHGFALMTNVGVAQSALAEVIETVRTEL